MAEKESKNLTEHDELLVESWSYKASGAQPRENFEVQSAKIIMDEV